jgi:hypothetical protein
MKNFNIILVFTVFFILIKTVFSSEESIDGYVSVENPIEILKMIAAQSKANYEKIQTWQGEYEIEEIQYIDSIMGKEVANAYKIPVSTFYKSTNGYFSFKIDMKSNSLSINFKTNDYLILDPAKTPIKNIKIPGTEQISIITPEHYLHFLPNVLYGSFTEYESFDPSMLTRASFREPVVSSQKKNLAEIPDPRSFFVFGGRTIWEATTLWVDILSENHGINNVFVGKQIDNVSNIFMIQRTINNKEKKRLTKYRFIIDANAACNVVKYSIITESLGAPPPTLIEDISWYFKEENGIFLPFSGVQRFGLTNSKDFRFERKLNYRTIEVNSLIDKKMFSFTQLGMKNGDRYVDTILKKISTFEDGKLLSKDTNKRIILKWNFIRIIFFITGIVLIIIGLLGKIKKNKKI